MARRKCPIRIIISGIAMMLVVTIVVLTITIIPPHLVPGEAHRRMLRSEVDHAALREECRELIARRAELDLNAEGNYVVRHQPVGTSPLPPVLAALDPQDVWLGDDSVELDWGGGFGHWGLCVFAEGHDGSDVMHSRRSFDTDVVERLTDGVWFYDLD